MATYLTITTENAPLNGYTLVGVGRTREEAEADVAAFEERQGPLSRTLRRNLETLAESRFVRREGHAALTRMYERYDYAMSPEGAWAGQR